MIETWDELKGDNMSLQYTSRSSLVERVIEQMRSQINAGEWTPGMRIPTESQLSNSLAGR